MKKISVEDLDRIFDDGEEDVLQYFDVSKTSRLNAPPRKINVDAPAWMVAALDNEARRIGVTRQSIIKTWLADRLDALHAARRKEN